MGGAMAKNLVEAGFSLSVWNRSPEKAQPLLDAGASKGSSPQDVGTNCDVLLTCVTNDKALEDVLLGENGALTGQAKPSLVVDFSTVSSATIKRIGVELAKNSISLIDAPVSGGDVGAQNGTLVIMAGGTEKNFKRAESIFNVLGKKNTHTGPLGSGQLTKCVNQLVVAVTISAMTEGLLFAEDAGLNLETTLDIISGGAAGSWALENYAPRVLAGNFEPGFYARDMLKDLRIALEQASTQSTDTPVAKLVSSQFEELISKNPDVGNHALIQLYRGQHV
ncbi:UNVERIFIED_CONTAM: hypothetical protein GTU68_031746 [Idotea baltica]|nr:hypothetical protein [Idotea baltica]